MKRIFIFAVIALSLLSAESVLAATNDYTNYWTMDEGTGQSVNDSVGGQNGAMTGTASGFGWASGKVGTGVGMDATAGTGIVLPNGFLQGSQGTISLWLNAQSLTSQNVIFSGKSTTDNYVYAALLVDSDGRPTFQYRDSTNGNDNKAQGAKLLNKNEWYNVVFTANAQTYRIYVNGEEVQVGGNNIGKWFPDITNQTFMYRIGMIDSSPLSGSWNGYLDDMRIYARALSADEVKELYTTSNAARPTNPASVAPKVSLTITDDHVPYGGSVAVNWTSVNVDTCAFISDNATTTTSGQRVYTKLAADTSFTLTCSNAKYGSDSATVKVVVGTTATETASSSLTVVQLPPVSAAPSVGTTYTRNLTVGSRGDDVKQLQMVLIEKGHLSQTMNLGSSVSTATGYFGPLTKAAVVKLQKEMGLPSTGFFGPMTRAALNK